MIDINDFPHGTVLSFLGGSSLMSGFKNYKFFLNRYKDTTTMYTFLDKIDLNKVENLENEDFETWIVNDSNDGFILNLPNIVTLKLNNLRYFPYFNQKNEIVLNLGENLERLNEIIKPFVNGSKIIINSPSTKLNYLSYDFNDGVLEEFYFNVDSTNLTSVGATYSNRDKLLYHSGFPNIKISITSYYYDKFPNLTRESYISIFNNLYDFVGNGETPKSNEGKIKLHANYLTVCTQEDINIALNRGWVIST